MGGFESFKIARVGSEASPPPPPPPRPPKETPRPPKEKTTTTTGAEGSKKSPGVYKCVKYVLKMYYIIYR